MHVSRVHVRGFKRFHDLTVEVPGEPRLVVMCGPNGIGKSSLIDAFRFWHGAHGAGEGWRVEDDYHRKVGEAALPVQQLVEVDFAEGTVPDRLDPRKLVYARTAYRHEADFNVGSIARRGELLDAPRARKMIEDEKKVSDNYQRLVSSAIDDLFSGEHDGLNVGELRESRIGAIREAMLELFPDLELLGPGDPVGGGTFFFRKGESEGFHYKNLSGGEKAVFDLVLDLVIKGEAYDDTVICVDEPELHLNTRVQADLLSLLMRLTPQRGQLWVATHSLGMMRRAQEIAYEEPDAVAFLDFEGHRFDEPAHLTPVKPNREFWSRTLDVALGDMASLIAPDAVVLCEGRPVGAAGNMNMAKAEFDARCYRRIFTDNYPRTDFISVGNAAEVQLDRVELGRAIQTLVSGTSVIRVVDRDLRSQQEIDDLRATGTRVLSRRHLESYLLDDEVLEALCASVEQAEKFEDVKYLRDWCVADSVNRGNDPDDMKRAAGDFYSNVRQMLRLAHPGNSVEAFLSDTLAPLVKPSMNVYAALEEDIFGVS